MPGETSKTIGDFGHDLAEKILRRFQWNHLGDSGVDVKCEDPKHRTKSQNSDKETHGLDGVFSYTDPFTGALKVIIVEAKALTWRKSSTSDQNKTNSALAKQLNEFCETLFEKISCAKRSEHFRSTFGLESRSFEVHGLLIYHVHTGFVPADFEEIKKKIVLPEESVNSALFIATNSHLDRMYAMFRHLDEFSENKTQAPLFHYPDQELAKSKQAWLPILTIEKLFSSFVVASVKPKAELRHHIYYSGTISQQSIHRFCAAMSRFQTYSLTPLYLGLLSPAQAANDRIPIKQFFVNNDLEVEGKELKIELMQVDSRPLTLDYIKTSDG